MQNTLLYFLMQQKISTRDLTYAGKYVSTKVVKENNPDHVMARGRLGKQFCLHGIFSKPFLVEFN